MLHTLTGTGLLNAGRRSGRLRSARLLQARPGGLGWRALLRLTGSRRLSWLLLLTRTILQARLWPGAVLSRQSVLSRSARRVATIDARIGAAEGALLVDDAAAEILRRVNLTHEALVALHLLR